MMELKLPPEIVCALVREVEYVADPDDAALAVVERYGSLERAFVMRDLQHQLRTIDRMLALLQDAEAERDWRRCAAICFAYGTTIGSLPYGVARSAAYQLAGIAKEVVPVASPDSLVKFRKIVVDLAADFAFELARVADLENPA